MTPTQPPTRHSPDPDRPRAAAEPSDQRQRRSQRPTTFSRVLQPARQSIVRSPLQAKIPRTAVPQEPTAILIDVENVAAQRIAAVLHTAHAHGTVQVRRGYGDWSQRTLTSWREPLALHGIRPVHQPGYTTGRNAADIALAIDAIDLLHTTHIRRFVLVTSDSDFTGLALHLRESGCTVHGFGERKTPTSFTTACSTFTYLDGLPPPATTAQTETSPPRQTTTPPPPPTSPAPAATNPLQLPPHLREQLRALVDQAAGPDGWTHQATAGSHAKQLPGLDITQHGHTKFGTFIQATGLFDIDTRTPGPGKPPVIYLRSKPKP
ncbi:NYN domain-containing protein [Nocardia wallacei]|uniref:NYN domain-containing protein n=1 Tax=Nocardia wallacei TaxID=480035 RepID=UPI002455CC0C|nr:NYN domain-containing protein [Nocardia wallacei]